MSAQTGGAASGQTGSAASAQADETVVAVLGIGRVGSTIARAALDSGYRVVVAGSGSADDIRLTVDIMIPGAEARAAADAVLDADLVVLAVPFGRFPSLPLASLDGKVVLDMMNHWQAVDGDVPHIQVPASTSEAVAAAVPNARIVKSLNHIGYHEIEEDGLPSGADNRRAVAVASDHEEAAGVVARFVDRIGFDPVDVGALANGVQLEPGRPLFGARLNAAELRGSLAGDVTLSDVA